MSERGPKGDHGQHGDAGQQGRPGASGPEGLQGRTGERGPHGDVGQAGKVGATGETGDTGRLTTQAKLAFVALTVVFAALLSVMGYQINENTKRAAEGREAHVALCVLRGDLDRRVQTATRLLGETEGPLIFGIPRGAIKQSRDSQRETVELLSRLDCQPSLKEE